MSRSQFIAPSVSNTNDLAPPSLYTHLSNPRLLITSHSSWLFSIHDMTSLPCSRNNAVNISTPCWFFQLLAMYIFMYFFVYCTPSQLHPCCFPYRSYGNFHI